MDVISEAEIDQEGVTTKLIDFNKIIRIETDLIKLHTQVFVQGALTSEGPHKSLTEAVKSHLISSASLRGDRYVNVSLH